MQTLFSPTQAAAPLKYPSPKVCHLIHCSSADTARWRDFLFLPFLLLPSYTYTHSPPAQRVAVTQKLMSRNERSVTSAALCQSGFTSLRCTHESLRFSCLSGPCKLHSLPCIFNEAAFVCVDVHVCGCVYMCVQQEGTAHSSRLYLRLL